MILSVSRYVADKEEQRRREEMENNDAKLQAAAQALLLQARELAANSDLDEENILEPVVEENANPTNGQTNDN